MTEPSFVVFKYQHADPLVTGGAVWATWWALLALLAVSVYFLGPVGIVPVVIVAIVVGMRWPKRCISLGARFLVCGHTLAYYKNIRKVVLRPGHLTLHWGNKGLFKLEQVRFPTNARKTHKIEKNKADKFQKVSRKIIQRVLAESPSVELVGIDRAALSEKGS